MLTLPAAIVPILIPCATLFTNPTWRKAQLLMVGAILTTGQRTVAAALRVIGRSDAGDFARYHEALNRAVWSPRAAARILLLLLQHLDRGDGPLVFGVRSLPIGKPWSGGAAPGSGPCGICRDAVRSSRRQLVKASGLRWIALMWLGPVPWAGRHWALPALTVQSPSSRYHQQQGRRHKRITDWARQMVMQLRRWLPHRPIVLVGDNGNAVLDILHPDRRLVPLGQAGRHHPLGAGPRPPGRLRSPGPALHRPCGGPDPNSGMVVLRRQLEVTFQEVRAQMGVETQRQWSDLAIARTTPILLGLFSSTTLAAHGLQQEHPITQRTAAWYDKPSPTFVDAIALARRHLWLASEGFHCQPATLDFVQSLGLWPSLRILGCG